MKSKLLLIEDDESFVQSLRLALSGHDIDVVWAETGALGIETYRKDIHGFATVIIDYCLPDVRGSEVAIRLKKLNPVQDLLFASGFDDPAFLIDLLETGRARSFLAKGRPIAELRECILESIAIYQNQNRVLGRDEYIPSKAELDLRNEGFIGRSAGMHEVVKLLRKYRLLRYGVLITGETGVGKELVARALVPKGKTLITLNCARFTGSEQLLESELFGHVKGAFTGADRDKAGLLTAAHGQVVFLDELHELSWASQAKILRLAEAGKYRRVGDHQSAEISVQMRLICAASPEIPQKVRSGQFKEDLLHRVSALEIQVPPLRERTEDIEPLVRHFQDEFNQGRPEVEQRQVRISTIREMAKMPWTGNVRQLQNIVRRMLAGAEGEIVGPQDLERALGGSAQAQTLAATPRTSLAEATKEFESEQIKRMLAQCRTQAETAVRLGLDPSTLLRKMIRLGINAEAYLART